MNVTDATSLAMLPGFNVTQGTQEPQGQPSAVNSHHAGHIQGQAATATQSLERIVDDLNKRIAPNMKVEFDYDKQSKRIWINVVDAQTGRIVAEFPPETVRKIVDSTVATLSGLTIDKQS